MFGKLFDSEVRARRLATPWAEISLPQFAGDVVTNAPGDRGEFTLSLVYDHRQTTREWWTVSWIAADGKPREVSSQRFDLVLWRAAHIEEELRRKLRRQAQLEAGSWWDERFMDGGGI